MANRLDTPSIPTELADEESQANFSEAVKECVEVLEGKRGDGMDRALTPRDLSELGIITVSGAAINSGGSSSGVGIGAPVTGTGTGTAVVVEVVDFPTTPTGLAATGAFTNIGLSWDKPTFRGYAHTEIWRYDANNITAAILIATSSHHMFSDPVDPDSTYYYWIRFVNTSEEKGDYNQTSGTLGETDQTVDRLIADLNAATGNSALSQTLRSQLNNTIVAAGPTQPIAHPDGRLLVAGDRWIDTELVNQAGTDPVVQVPKNDTYLYSGSAWDATENSGIAGAIADAASAAAIADGKVRMFYQTTAPTEQTDTLDGGDLWIDVSEAVSGDGVPQNILNRWDISVIPFAWVEVPDANIAGALQAAGIAKTTADRKVMVYFLATAPAGTTEIPIDLGDLWIDTDDGDKAYRWSGTTWVALALATNASVDTQIIEQVGYCEYTSAAGISSVAGAYSTKTLCENAVPSTGASFVWKTNGAIASELKTVSTTVGGHTSTISDQTSSINGLRSQKVVKIDNNTGKIVGYGLASGFACLINDIFDESKDQAQCATAGGVWTDSSEFAINVDHFKISSPDGDVTPFQVVTDGGMCVYGDGSTSTTVTELNCKGHTDFKAWIPEGVYMTNAMIMDASIDVAKIGNLTVDKADVTGLLTVQGKIEAGLIDASRITLSPSDVGAGGVAGSSLVINHDTISVYYNGVLRVRIGRLGE